MGKKVYCGGYALPDSPPTLCNSGYVPLVLYLVIELLTYLTLEVVFMIQFNRYTNHIKSTRSWTTLYIQFAITCLFLDCKRKLSTWQNMQSLYRKLLENGTHGCEATVLRCTRLGVYRQFNISHMTGCMFLDGGKNPKRH